MPEIIELFLKNKAKCAYRAGTSVEVMLKAIEYLPENTRLHLTAASLYERLKITYRAKEEYNRVLLLDPNNRDAKKRLAELNSTATTPS